MPVWFEITWEIEEVTKKDGTITWFMFHQPSELSSNEEYQFIMKKVLYPIAVYLIPLILISVLNMRILSYISYKRLESIGHKRRMAKERRSVMLLISIVLLFFICHTGGLVIRFFDFQKYGNVPCFIFAKDLINFLFNINSFANPMLYFFFTRQFQDLKTTWVANGSSNMVTKRLLKTFSTRSTRTESPVKI
uniref:G-protein coupled receptors family 1 profile domain-containing protein n=1 Tax=Acrobeloides nanus TaxID=290746 RepID=A0A914BZF6_9BILA